MSLTKGSISMTLFRVANRHTFDHESAMLGIRRYSFRPIDDTRGEKSASGWCDPFDPRNRIDGIEEIDGGGALLLGWRRDTKSIAGPIYKAEVSEEIEKMKHVLGVARVSRQKRLAAQEDVERRMLADVSARTKIVDVVWDTVDGILAIYSVSESIVDEIVELFGQTFGASAALIVPGGANCKDTADSVAFIDFNAPIFLTDLWRDILRQGPISRNHSVNIVKAMEFSRGRRERVQVRGEQPSDYSESVAAGRDGKMVAGVKLRIDEGEHAWTFGLDAKRFAIAGAKIKSEPAETVLAVAVERYRDARHVFDLVDAMVKAWLECKASEPVEEELFDGETFDGGDEKNKPDPVLPHVAKFRDTMQGLARKHGINMTIETDGADPVSIDFKANG